MKKFIALLLAVLMMASLLAACGGGNSNSGNSGSGESGNSGQASDPFAGQTDIQLKVWADTKVTALTEELCNKFKEQYPDKNITIEVVAQGENDVTSQLLNDPETAADVFSFPSDQLTNLTVSFGRSPRQATTATISYTTRESYPTKTLSPSRASSKHAARQARSSSWMPATVSTPAYSPSQAV